MQLIFKMSFIDLFSINFFNDIKLYSNINVDFAYLFYKFIHSSCQYYYEKQISPQL